ncbi:MAG: HAMP domain-containing histidine kinase [Anaerolineae bacterium]|jgi:signal transduction histidine kinase|nr:HAMP domain-containing histidine kinase [Anaerolineae bacterium]MBT7074627.1 HAMP domain-containing histidine kinase [Anaerolineae bacterium]MBT7783580.1 HAMP domain-containing histidine kinase [Anaerolineae bacterium]
MKIFSTLRSRLWLSYALIIFAALGLLMLALFIYLLRSPILYRQTRSNLQAVKTVVLKRQGEFNERTIEKTLARTDENFDLRLLLLNSKGALVYDTRADEGRLKLPSLERLREDSLMRDENGNIWLYSAALLNNGQRLIIATPRPEVQVLAVLKDELLPPFWGAGAVAILLSLLLAFLMARWIADPLQKILVATREVPAQIVSSAEKGPQEVRELTQAFNEMVTRVQSTQQSQREFVANVSHELKTPLTSIQGFSQALLDGTAETLEARNQAAQVIYDESSRMHRLALDLLDLARFDAGIVEMDFAKIDLASLLRNTEEKFALRASQKSIKLEINIDGDFEILGDGDRLAQVFTNLVDNALKHTSVGGTIQIKADDYGGEKHIEIRDTGTGISPEALPYIFERFYQADPSRRTAGKSSSGLGLAIVKEIVLAHGGKITAESIVKIGTVFQITLPFAQVDITTIISRRRKHKA